MTADHWDAHGCPGAKYRQTHSLIIANSRARSERIRPFTSPLYHGFEAPAENRYNALARFDSSARSTRYGGTGTNRSPAVAAYSCRPGRGSARADTVVARTRDPKRCDAAAGRDRT